MSSAVLELPAVNAAPSAAPSQHSAARVFLAMPHYGNVEAATLGSVLTASATVFPFVTPDGGSLLAFVFNRLFCEFMNIREERGLTHFAMLHSDIAPDPLWLDVMLAEMARVDADVLSAIVPLKDGRGLTSCAWSPADSIHPTRFTMREVFDFPVTFDAAGCGHASDHLLLNTGLWVARPHPWMDDFPGFHILDGIARTPEGKRVAQVFSEDWNWSKHLARRGDVRAFATRAVPLAHYGKAAFRNDSAWGTCQTDPGDGAAA